MEDEGDQIEQSFGVRRSYDQGRAEGRAEGKAEGLAEEVVRVLRHRGRAITTEQLRQILVCTDLAIVNGWFARSFSVASVDELLA